MHRRSGQLILLSVILAATVVASALVAGARDQG